MDFIILQIQRLTKKQLVVTVAAYAIDTALLQHSRRKIDCLVETECFRVQLSIGQNMWVILSLQLHGGGVNVKALKINEKRSRRIGEKQIKS